ncbi:MAG: deoxyribodipyrimidine photo-lyase [Pelovirga sp.]
MSTAPSILWFRQDLRLSDNPALAQAARRGDIFPIYILDDDSAGCWRMGGASRWWLHQSLAALDRALAGQLHLFRGSAEEILGALVDQLGAGGVYWNRCYEPWRISRDARIKERLQSRGIEVHSSNSALLWEPWEVLKQDGTPYRVFTPYFRKGCLGRMAPRPPVDGVPLLRCHQGGRMPQECTLNDLQLLPQHPWHRQLEPHWQPGEAGARSRLNDFLQRGLAGYRQGRDYPAGENISRLSAHLHFGEISPQQVWYAARQAGDGELPGADLEHFLTELGWREFSYYQLFHEPTLPTRPLRAEFDRFPWIDDGDGLRSWQRGETGYPLVDAGLRELWQTGFMHNRVRMVVGSFLVKNQLLHWRQGERWFWDCLVDADLASNSASWQWVAGCGADAAPYFRIFNPVTQGERFDPRGHYVRRFVPELQGLPDRYVHAPWTAPTVVLDQANLRLGKDYPVPIVDLKSSRQRALDAYQLMRRGG